MNYPIKVLIVDDHQMFSDGLKAILKTYTNYDVAETCHSSEEALRYLETHNIDVVTVDVNMPEMNGVELTQRIKSFGQEIKVLGISMNEELSTVQKMIQAGADGFLFKNLNEDNLMNALDIIVKGGHYLTDELTYALTSYESQNQNKSVLTRRELDVIKLVAQGMQNNEIAEELHISLFTVKSHRKNILSKLNLRNTADLVRYCFENKLT